MSRVSSLDTGYESGDLSVYPEAIDTKDQLYEVKNNAKTTLKNSLNYTGRIIVVEDTALFPDTGLIRVGPEIGEPGSPELIYYDAKSNNVFSGLIRGFAGSRQNFWPAGSVVANSVNAEHHNATKDAIINIQTNLGLIDAEATLPTESGPLNGILKELEDKFLTPRPYFRVTYLKGPPPLTVQFQNLVTGDIIRYLWDFGDGSTSTEQNPTHTYYAEGSYSVSLEIISSTGGGSVLTKNNYITVSEEDALSFFYVSPSTGTTETTFKFVDQTDGDIVGRFWLFGDGESLDQDNPNVHTATHTYAEAGTYDPSLLIVFSDQSLKRLFLQERVVVTDA